MVITIFTASYGFNSLFCLLFVIWLIVRRDSFESSISTIAEFSISPFPFYTLTTVLTPYVKTSSVMRTIRHATRLQTHCQFRGLVKNGNVEIGKSYRLGLRSEVHVIEELERENQFMKLRDTSTVM